MDRLRRSSNASEKKILLETLRETLSNQSTKENSAAIHNFLESGADAQTAQGFTVGGTGFLIQAPTFRTLLLDLWGQIDPAAAASYARIILNQSTSPDEWAIALRNLARGDTTSEARSLLEAKTDELLRNESWQQNPSVGYLEAFDTAVYLGSTNLLPALGELIRKKDNQAVAHAAFLTMDRLVINQPAATLSALNEHADWMQGREETRANFFARADVSDSIQRELVESYLLDPAHNAAELQTFAGVFPNANFMISPNLLTSNSTLDGATLSRRDQAALEVVNQWLADPRFRKANPALQTMKSRLMEFTKQPNKAAN